MRRDIEARLARGDRCYAVWVEGRIVHAAWLATGRARVDYLDVSFDKYSGGLTNGSVGIEYQMFRHLGVSLSYQYFGLDVDVKDTNWRGGVEVTLRGPFLSLTANW